MALIVQKYGGTSVGTVERIQNVAKKVIQTKNNGNDVVVVLSAMAGKTDRLIDMARLINKDPDPRELDVLLATGEQVSIALFSIACKTMGHDAQSFLGFQAQIMTDHRYGMARIHNIDTEEITQAIEQGKIVVIAGFQGMDEFGNITTLGRGGSDTTAVGLAAALNASVCEIYTDVEGVYTTDPNITKKARKLKYISYEEMLEMASMGAKVLHLRSVEFAVKYEVPLHVRSSFVEAEGTMVVKGDTRMEKVAVSAIAYNKNEARLTIIDVPDKPGIAALIFQPISDAGISVDMIIQNSSIHGTGMTDMTFTVAKDDYTKALNILKNVAGDIGAKDVQGDIHVAKVSAIGLNMRNHSGIASKMFSVLSEAGINIIMISTSEIKVSTLIHEDYTELAVRLLHNAFELDQDQPDFEL